MDPIRNPYVPNAGAPPATLPGRQDLVEAFKVALARTKAGRTAKSLIPYGLRGVGKTVLLNRCVDEARGLGYLVAYIEADEQGKFISTLATELRSILFALDAPSRVNEFAKRAMRMLKSFTVKAGLEGLSMSIGVDPERGAADTGDLQVDLTAIFLAIGDAARAADTAVLIAIDEVQYLSELEFSAMIMAIHRVTQRQLPLLVMATGLPQVLALAGDAKSYAERLFDYRMIGALAHDDARAAIVDPALLESVEYNSDALERLFEITEGYPFFIQEWGYHTWNAADASPIAREVVDRVENDVLKQLDESFFRVRYNRVSPTEKRYLRAMAELGAGPYRSKEVAAQLDLTLSQAGPTRDSLIKKGMIYSPEHGEIAFTVPLFDGFMRRTEPTFERRQRSEGS